MRGGGSFFVLYGGDLRRERTTMVRAGFRRDIKSCRGPHWHCARVGVTCQSTHRHHTREVRVQNKLFLGHFLLSSLAPSLFRAGAGFGTLTAPAPNTASSSIRCAPEPRWGAGCWGGLGPQPKKRDSYARKANVNRFGGRALRLLTVQDDSGAARGRVVRWVSASTRSACAPCTLGMGPGCGLHGGPAPALVVGGTLTKP